MTALTILGLVLFACGAMTLAVAEELYDDDPWREMERLAEWLTAGVLMLVVGAGIALFAGLQLLEAHP